nr:RNase A-like domain-containing protein [Pantoea allii]
MTRWPCTSTLGSSDWTQVRSAEEAISKALFANRDVIKSVLSGGRLGARLTIRNASGKAIGYGFRRGGSQRIVMKNVRVVIEFQQYNGKPYYILTAFPDL